MTVKQDEPIFSARLTPYRSLGKYDFYILMSLVSISCLMSGMLFWMAGAWPVMVFLLADIFILWLAFKLNYRSALASEEVRIWPHKVELKKCSPTGKVSTVSFNPYWTRFQLSRHSEAGIVKMVLASKEQAVEFGSFLNPLDKESFAKAFSLALAKAKRV